MTSQGVIPNEVRRDAVPNEARNARVVLGRSKQGDFFEQPQVWFKN
jgi:hypothetical protein